MTGSSTTKTLIFHPYLKSVSNAARTPSARLEEAEGLAHAIDLEVAAKIAIPLTTIRPATLIGKGKVEEIAALVKDNDITLVVADTTLGPVQQRNLEKALNCKVIDRTALILEIFGERARTREGILQVELAALEYQKTRLVRSWTHLERQRGGFGFLGGPGESQIEIDRRLIRDRISKLKTELETVTRTRELHRKVRRDVPYPLIALVGYTNAGKSTLFNRLTKAKVLAMDKLFATLDPTLRAVTLPSGAKVILSDTVGFVSDLPTELVAAFRATLEEVVEADILLHVRDISHADTAAQARDVEHVLKSLLRTEALPEHVIEVHNKIDRLSEEEKEVRKASGAAIAVSAVTGEGTETLLHALDVTVAERFYKEEALRLAASEGDKLAWLHRHGVVAEVTPEGEELHVRARLSEENWARFKRL